MDDADRASEGRTFICPKCGEKFSDPQPEVAHGIWSNHITRNKCKEVEPSTAS